jgi:pilus assembly protein CpaE
MTTPAIGNREETVTTTYQYPQDPLAANQLSVVLIGSEGASRRALLEAFNGHQVTISGELGAYQNLEHLGHLLNLDCEVVVVDLDSDPDVGLDLVENICGRSSHITVMVYSKSQDPELLVRCMRAGAREFLSEPLTRTTMTEALVRAAARRGEVDRQRKVAGRILVFWGAKGGCGVTTVALNFAIALKRHSGRPVSLLDLKVQLGDAAVALGLQPRFSVSDALRNYERLDEEFLMGMLTDHERSGISLLASPDEFNPEPAIPSGSLGKLLHVMRARFPYVVVDGGPALGASAATLFEMADAIYVVAEADVPSLRNAERLLSHLRRPGLGQERVELVLNRYEPRKSEIDEGRIAKVLGAAPKWRIPNDYLAVRRSLNTGVPLALEGSAVSRAIHHMAWDAAGRPVQPDQRKKKWGLF